MANLSEVLDFLEEKEDLDWKLVNYAKKKNDKDIEAMVTERDTIDFLNITIKPGMLNWEIVVTTNKDTERFRVGILNNERMNRLENIYNKARSKISEDSNININEYA